MSRINLLVNSTKKLLNPSATITANFQNETCKSIIKVYNELYDSEKAAYVHILASLHEIKADVFDSKVVSDSAKLWTARKFRDSLVPAYRHMFISLANSSSGIYFLVKLREKVKVEVKCNREEKIIDSLRFLEAELFDLLKVWFAAGFYQLQRITWNSSCVLLQKISQLEAVHPIRSWVDLKARVGAYRRVYAFTHPSMPDEPIVILHTALVSKISSTMSDLLVLNHSVSGASVEEEEEDEDKIKAAVFYSVSAPHKGLQGIDLGQTIIKTVVGEIKKEFPDLKMFSSLSPIPGFRLWLINAVNERLGDMSSSEEELVPLSLRKSNVDGNVHSEADVLSALLHTIRVNLSSASGFQSFMTDDATQGILHHPETRDSLGLPLEALLRSLCIRYLSLTRHLASRGFVVNPVANFHLRNGAQLWRLNWMSDLTARGVDQSFGLMVNYRYFLSVYRELSSRYITDNIVSISPLVEDINHLQSHENFRKIKIEEFE